MSMGVRQQERVRKKEGRKNGREDGRRQVECRSPSLSAADVCCAVVEMGEEARALGERNGDCLFCFAFFSVQKSRPDASMSSYVTDGV